MYEIGVQREFIAQHFLSGDDFGPEGELHSHHYVVEVTLQGAALNELGFLTDISKVHAALGNVVRRYADENLNELPELDGGNPSLERFAAAIAEQLRPSLLVDGIQRAQVTLWEDPTAWARFTFEA